MLALDSGATGEAWRCIAEELPRPRAIVVASAHWSTPVTMVGSGRRHATIHDFFGFPAALYQQRYDTDGDPALAKRLAAALDAADWPNQLDDQRGLDHGAWVPLKAMYPLADIPVVPVSINAHRDPGYHYRLGVTLRAALPDDALLIASGSLTHNLHDFKPGRDGEAPPEYVRLFQDWMYDRLQAADLPALLDYRQQAPAATLAHPSDDHLLPLYVALGAADPDLRTNRLLHNVTERILAMDVYSFAA